jgi:hypothetical protein
MMVYVDDFLTRRYWDPEPYPHGMGTNIPLDYKEMSIADEWCSLKKLKKMGVPFMVFIVGCVLDSKDPDIQAPIQWLVENGITIAGHGYFHTKIDYEDKYVPWAEKSLEALKKVGQKPPFLWRFPRHEEVNVAHIQKVGFELAPYDVYLDPELNEKKTFEVLRGHEHHNVWCHSVYLTRVNKCSQ